MANRLDRLCETHGATYGIMREYRGPHLPVRITVVLRYPNGDVLTGIARTVPEAVERAANKAALLANITPDPIES